MSAPLPADLLARLEDASRAPLRREGPGAPIAGANLEAIVAPADTDALGATLAVLEAARCPVAILGAGSKQWLGNPLRGARLGLATAGLAGLEELDEADGVVRVGAGTALDTLRDKAAAAGWLLPLDAPGPGTVGGALATALAGPRRLGFGPVRDAVLGLDTVLADGAVTRCGARVVKNVTGYDLAKLYVGSLGTLGVMAAAWLRLRAVPATTRVLQASLGEDAFDRGLAAARCSTARACALVSEPLASATGGLGAAPRDGGRHRLVVELAGEGPATDRDAGALARACGAEAAPQGSIDALGTLRVHTPAIGVRVRVHVRPGDVAACARVLEAGGAAVLATPEPGQVIGWFEAALDDGEDPWWLDRVLTVVEEARAAGRGEGVLESLPAWGRGRRDVFGGSPALASMRSLKARFDPHGLLNPGRFVGSI